MRILFLYMFPLWGNGSGSYFRALSAQLTKQGHRIAIIAPETRTVDQVKIYPIQPPQNGVFVGHPEMPQAKKFGDMDAKELGEIYASYLKTTLEVVSDFKPEVIHVFHTVFLPEIARVLKALYGIKYIITTHGSDLSYLVKDRRFIPLIADANRAAKYIHANSDFTKEWYMQMFGRDIKRKMVMLMGGVDINNFKRDPAQIEKINTTYNLTGKKVVLFTGRLTIHKGVIYLVKAAATIKGTVVIVGDGPERPAIEEEIKDRKLTNVVLVGYVNNTDPIFHAFYERADVYVSPSIWDEPLGLTILEAMGSRTAVVATRKGGVVDIISEEVNGYMIRARNSKEIATTVNMLLEDDVLREKIADQAHKTVLEKFTWQRIAQRFEKLYEDCRTKEKIKDAGPLDDLVKKIFWGK